MIRVISRVRVSPLIPLALTSARLHKAAGLLSNGCSVDCGVHTDTYVLYPYVHTELVASRHYPRSGLEYTDCTFALDFIQLLIFAGPPGLIGVRGA